MEVVFDNKANVLVASIRAAHDRSEMYRLKSTFGFLGRRLTVMREVQPIPVSSSSPRVAGAKPKEPETKVVGAIHWQEKLLEVHGVKKKWKDIRRVEAGGFLGLRKRRLWRWAPERKEYFVRYDEEDQQWKASVTSLGIDPSADPDKDKPLNTVEATLSIQSHPPLFKKARDPTLYLSPTALREDEIFLILVFVYEEAKRQDDNNSAVSAGSEGF